MGELIWARQSIAGKFSRRCFYSPLSSRLFADTPSENAHCITWTNFEFRLVIRSQLMPELFFLYKAFDNYSFKICCHIPQGHCVLDNDLATPRCTSNGMSMISCGLQVHCASQHKQMGLCFCFVTTCSRSFIMNDVEVCSNGNAANPQAKISKYVRTWARTLQ